jgi:hypothetical protein
VPKNRRSSESRENYVERRTSPRLPPTAFPALKSACLSSGSEVTLINISKGGALLESVDRLAPSTRISLRVITTEGILILQGKILRCMISHLNGGLRYRSAVAFDQEFPLRTEEDLSDTQAEKETPTVSQVQGPEGQEGTPEPAVAGQEAKGDGTGFLTLTACVLQGEPDLSELFRVNKW